MQQEERKFLPTKPARILPGTPAGIADMVMYFVQREDKGVEGFVYEAPAPAPYVKPVVTRNAVTRNWGLGNVTRFAHSLLP